MSWDKVLESFKIDEWYKVFVYVGMIGTILSIFFPVKVYSNQTILFLMFGLLLIGVGEWTNYYWKSWIKEANVFTGDAALMKAKIRKPTIIGILLIFFGICLIVMAILQILNINPF